MLTILGTVQGHVWVQGGGRGEDLPLGKHKKMLHVSLEILIGGLLEKQLDALGSVRPSVKYVGEWGLEKRTPFLGPRALKDLSTLL